MEDYYLKLVTDFYADEDINRSCSSAKSTLVRWEKDHIISSIPGNVCYKKTYLNKEAFLDWKN